MNHMAVGCNNINSTVLSEDTVYWVRVFESSGSVTMKLTVLQTDGHEEIWASGRDFKVAGPHKTGS
jgi:hypothetical protein